jgi:NADH-quinone oxidoreductase subunit E
MQERDMERLIDRHSGPDRNIIVLLQDIQKLYGYLPETALAQVSGALSLPLSELYSTATFYAQFRFVKPGRHQIKVCHGTACHINGAVAVSDGLEEKLEIRAGGTTTDEKFSLENVACLGCCSLSPVLMIGEKVYGNLDKKKAVAVLREFK